MPDRPAVRGEVVTPRPDPGSAGGPLAVLHGLPHQPGCAFLQPPGLGRACVGQECDCGRDAALAAVERLREERDALAEALTAIRDCAKWYGREPFAFAIAAAIREAAS